MSFPAYEDSKDSDVKFLGNVPLHWEVMLLRRCLLDHRQGYYSSEAYVDDGIKLLRITDIGDFGEIDISECPRVAQSEDLAPFLLETDDFVFARTGGAGTFGLVPELPEPVIYASYLIRFRFNENVISEFLKYFFQASCFQDAIQQNIHGGVNQNVHAEDIKNQAIALPPPDEQKAISSFLDVETSKIDGLVSEQRRLIELLKEKRQAVISHAVTKGLNPNAPMKPSGIQWLGDVPEHWEETRIDRVTEFVNGKAHEPFVDEDGEFICVNSRFVSTDGEAVKMCSRNLTPAEHDDVLMVMSDLPNGRALARTFHVRDDRRYAINQRVCAIRSRAPVPRFLFYLLNRNPWFLQRDDGLNQTHLPRAAFRKMPFFLPPLDEQRKIASNLDRLADTFVALSNEAERAIDLLQERRTALISAAVTGKIDVRQIAPVSGKALAAGSEQERQ